MHSVTACPSIDLDAEAFQRALRIGREIVGKARQHARAGLDQHDARLVGVDVAEVGRQRVARQFGDGAGEFDAGRAGADDDEGQQRGAPLRIGLALGALEGDEDAPPQRGGVLERLQARRERLPFVMAEIGVPRAGGEHQRVVGHGVAVIEQHALAAGVDAGHVGEQGRDLRPVAQEIADRPGDLRGRQRGGRDLIEQRLEQMVVAAVDQGDARPARPSADAPSPARQSRRRRSPRDGVLPALRSWVMGLRGQLSACRVCMHLRAGSKALCLYRSIAEASSPALRTHAILRRTNRSAEISPPSPNPLAGVERLPVETR